MRYRYVAYATDQGVLKGKVEARTNAEALLEVERLGYRPLELAPMAKLPSREELFPTLYRVKVSELARFSRHLAAILASGGSLVRGLEMLHGETKSGVFRKTIASLRRDLDEGRSLSEALKEHPLVFNQLYVSVVEVGEFTGRLGPALEQIAEVLERESEAKRKAIRTLLYPVAIIGLAVITLVILMMVALPPLLAVFERMDTEVPLMTRIVVATFNQVRDKAVFFLFGMVCFVVVLALLRRLPSVRFAMDRFQARAPVIGPVTIAGEMASFSRSMSMLLEAGVSLSSALKLGISGCKNSVIRKAFLEAEESLLSGRGLTVALRRHPILPTLFIELVMIGEESNSLRRTMKDAAHTYQQQQEQKLDGLLATLEPASTLIVGAVVGLIAFSMFVPIYSGLQAFD